MIPAMRIMQNASIDLSEPGPGRLTMIFPVGPAASLRPDRDIWKGGEPDIKIGAMLMTSDARHGVELRSDEPLLRIDMPTSFPPSLAMMSTGLYAADAIPLPVAQRLATRVRPGTGAEPVSGPALNAGSLFLLASLSRGRNLIVDKSNMTDPGATLSTARFRRVLNYIEAEGLGRVDAVSLAEAAAQSRYHFSRSFKRRTGSPPQKYLIERRLWLVETLLATTDILLDDIALQSGFSSQSHMTTTFRRWFGIPPGRYRQLWREDLFLYSPPA